MKVNLFEIAEKIEKGEISINDKLVAKAESLIREMASTEQGQQELGEIVKISLEDSYNSFNIIPLLFETKHFKLGERPMFKTHKKGIKAYWSAPNSFIPNSQNYDTEIFMSFESLGVRPTCLLSDLKSGRVDSLASLVKDGKDAIEMAIYHKVYTVIAQTYNEVSGSQYFDNTSVTNTLSQTVLDKGINKIRKKVGGTPTIIADYDICTQIEAFEGFKGLEAVYTEIRNHGLLGMYRGCNIVYLPEIIDPVTGLSIVPTNKLFIVGKKIGVYGDYNEMDMMQDTNMDDKSWECRIDKECGFAITKPEGLYCIEITE